MTALITWDGQPLTALAAILRGEGVQGIVHGEHQYAPPIVPGRYTAPPRAAACGAFCLN